MFDQLAQAWILEIYKSRKALLMMSMKKQLTQEGMILDLNSLPTNPYPFKELFLKWLIMVNRSRLERGQDIMVTHGIVLQCPLWKIVKCPMKKIKLTKEGMFNQPKPVIGSIGAKPLVKSINK